jgi:Right handed beta helix region
VLVRRAKICILLLLVTGACLGVTPSVASERGARDCDGVQVRASASLSRVMSRHGPGTTYCLAAGTFRVTRTITTDVGDRVIGAGRNATFIDGRGLSPTADSIFGAEARSYFAHLDIFGAPTPAAGSAEQCSPRPDCGKAFSLRGSSLTLQSIDCHDNGGNCIGGGGSSNITVDDLNCWHNGSAYSMTSSFRYAACIKRAAAYDTGNDTTVTNSYIHDNPWAGIWCDHCKHGVFRIENNRIIHNGGNGIQWEMSGGWSLDDEAIIRDNVIRRNNHRGADSWRGGISISSANDIVVASNTFGGNHVAGVNIIFADDRDPPQQDSRGVVIRDNTMNGDTAVGCSLAGVTCDNNG